MLNHANDNTVLDRAPTRIRPGCWRNVWRRNDGKAAEGLTDGQVLLDPFHYLAKTPWPSREVAEEKALHAQRVLNQRQPGLFTWIEARHMKT